MPHMKYVRNQQLWNICVLPYVSRAIKIHFSHVFGIVRVSISREIEECRICKKLKPLEYLFSRNFPVLSKFTIPMFSVLGVEWISASREICKKHLNLECLIMLFPYYRKSFSHVYEVFVTQLFLEYSQSIQENKRYGVHLKLRCVKTRKIVIFQNALCVSLFGLV